MPGENCMSSIEMSNGDPEAAAGPKFVDVKELISEYDVAEHIRRSEVYYKDFTSGHWQFRKPFMGFESAQLTTRLGVVLSNLDFFLEANVLDFGAGTAWLSRAVALMGGNAVALDVSPSTLKLAESYNTGKYPESQIAFPTCCSMEKPSICRPIQSIESSALIPFTTSRTRTGY
jgi:SAM-dependent methyltransferase